MPGSMHVVSLLSPLSYCKAFYYFREFYLHLHLHVAYIFSLVCPIYPNFMS